MIKIQSKAMSINSAWQGKRFKTKEYKEYEEEVLWQLKLQKHEMITGLVEVSYKFYLNRCKLTDVGNLEKPLSDIIVKAGLIVDDRYIKKIILEKFESKENYIVIEIKKYDKQ